MYHRWTMLLTVMINWVRLPYTAPHDPPVGHVALNVLIYKFVFFYEKAIFMVKLCVGRLVRSRRIIHQWETGATSKQI